MEEDKKKASTRNGYQLLSLDVLNEENEGWIKELWDSNFCLEEEEEESVKNNSDMLSCVPSDKWRDVIKVTKLWLSDNSNVSTNNIDTEKGELLI